MSPWTDEEKPVVEATLLNLLDEYANASVEDDTFHNEMCLRIAEELFEYVSGIVERKVKAAEKSEQAQNKRVVDTLRPVVEHLQYWPTGTDEDEERDTSYLCFDGPDTAGKLWNEATIAFRVLGWPESPTDD